MVELVFADERRYVIDRLRASVRGEQRRPANPRADIERLSGNVAALAEHSGVARMTAHRWVDEARSHEIPRSPEPKRNSLSGPEIPRKSHERVETGGSAMLAGGIRSTLLSVSAGITPHSSGSNPLVASNQAQIGPSGEAFRGGRSPQNIPQTSAVSAVKSGGSRCKPVDDDEVSGVTEEVDELARAAYAFALAIMAARPFEAEKNLSIDEAAQTPRRLALNRLQPHQARRAQLLPRRQPAAHPLE